MSIWQWLLYICFWSLFITVMSRHELATWTDFIVFYLSHTAQNIIAILPALFIIDYMRPVIKHSNPIKV
ncbi:MAG: histidine kinase, partial [Psychrobacter sp.]|nr:histidine kinase [Psychrobacter sp.]